MCLACIERAQANGTDNIESARIVEISDAAHGTWTSYTMSSGDTFEGNLSSSGDRDWVAIDMTAGQTYTFDLTGSPSGHGSLSDPYLRLHSGDGTQLAFNDDGGRGYESSLTYTAPTSGTFYISAGSYQDYYSGSYRLTVSDSEPAAPGTYDELANYLTHGYWQDNFASVRRFDTSSDNVITVNLSGLTPEGARLARWALESWELVSGIEFSETNQAADITFDDEDSGAYAISDVSGGFIQSSEVNVSKAWLASYGTSIDSYSYQTYVHEIGHALGLGHQGYYNGSASYPQSATFSNDSWQLSIMSYFSQDENSTVDASYAFLLTPMMADIIAIQNLYGAPGANSATAGDTTWGQGSTLPGVLADDSSLDRYFTGEPVSYTIYDKSGIDTLDLGHSDTNDRIDLRTGEFSDFGGLTGNIGIARGTFIENLITGSGNDLIQGNASANRINAQDGDDTIDGQLGNDTIDGGAGSDFLSGAQGSDQLRGGGRGDTVYGGGSTDTISGGNGQDELYGGNGNDRLYGGRHSDIIYGGAGDDSLYGGLGNDTLRGTLGNDQLTGGAGHDVFEFHADHGHDTISDFDASSNAEQIDISPLAPLTSFAEVRAASVQDGSDLIITTGENSSIRLENVLLDDLNRGDFIF